MAHFEKLEPNYPLTLDTSRQVENYSATNDPRLVETCIKLHGLFTPHLVLHEAQVLDHVAMRNFFLQLESNRKVLDELIRYLVEPGKDSLGLGPVIVASEYDPGDRENILPLRSLLSRKLGVNNSARVPWQLSSPAPNKQEKLNRKILESVGPDRLELGIKNVGHTPQEYEHYLELVSNVWDNARQFTRFNLDPPNYKQRLVEILGDLHDEIHGQTAETAEKLKEMIVAGALRFSDGRLIHQFDKTTINLWLKEQTGGGALVGMVTRAHPEAFVRAFPAKAGWLNSDDEVSLGTWRDQERLADERRKRTPANSLGIAAEELIAETDVVAQEEIATNGPLLLDRITYAQLRALRDKDEFQESLKELDEEWRHCYNYSFFLRTLRKHVDLIYQHLGARRRSSPLRRCGPSIKIEISKDLEQSSAIAEGLGLLALNISALKILPVWVVIKNLYSWSRPSMLQRNLYELADRVGEAARERPVARASKSC